MPEPTALIAEHSIRIQASPDAVWEVLTRTACIKEWDDVPGGFTADALSAGSVLEWDGYAVLTVTGYDAPRSLRMAYHSPKWSQPVDGIGYGYMIRPMESGCELTLRVGDWALAPDGNGKEYFDASVDFVVEAAAKIKDIAERR
jgi:uncharacterized protein YndB with AHSA1/START domain